jgi:hypothetical protein
MTARPLTTLARQIVTIVDYQGAQETGARFSGGMGTARAIHALTEIGALIESGPLLAPGRADVPARADRRRP